MTVRFSFLYNIYLLYIYIVFKCPKIVPNQFSWETSNTMLADSLRISVDFRRSAFQKFGSLIVVDMTQLDLVCS